MRRTPTATHPAASPSRDQRARRWPTANSALGASSKCVMPMRLAILALCVGLAAGTAAAAPLPSLNDEFDVPGTAAQWQEIKGDLADGVVPTWDISQSTPGELTITPGRSWWVDGTRAFYLYKPVSGDFVVTARLHVTGRDGPVPTADWSLSGLLVRRPTDDRGKESWVSFRIGRRAGKDVFERK